jgi:hypothetical protein
MNDQPRKGYKSKTVKAVLRKKIDEWTKTIDDPYVKNLVEKNTIVTGGAIASMLLGEKVNDFDVYFKDYTTTLAVARYYLKKFEENKKADAQTFKIYVADGLGKEIPEDQVEPSGDSEDDKRVMIVCRSAGVATEKEVEKDYRYFEGHPDHAGQQYVAEVMTDSGDIEDTYVETEEALHEQGDSEVVVKDYRPVFLSTNAITLTGRIQVVIRFWGEPDKIHENYDFVHCTNYWTAKDGELVLRKEALEALLSRELRYVGSRYPLCSIIRLRKFIRRGWTINAGQILKMVMQVHGLALTNIKVLRDQLTGVDSAYFAQVLDRLKDKTKDNTIDSAYLVEIIDRMF